MSEIFNINIFIIGAYSILAAEFFIRVWKETDPIELQYQKILEYGLIKSQFETLISKTKPHLSKRVEVAFSRLPKTYKYIVIKVSTEKIIQKVDERIQVIAFEKLIKAISMGRPL